MLKNDNRPIGVIDSGIGGLSVARQMLRQLPNETIVYLGDNKRCPYGVREPGQVKDFTYQMVNFVLKHDIKLLIIACNTATAIALDSIQADLDIPVIGVIAPGARAAIRRTDSGRVGVIATTATVESHSYLNNIKFKNAEISVVEHACPRFVPLVESNDVAVETVDRIVSEELTFFNDKDIDTLILGCTHYPFLRSSIERARPDVKVIDSGAQTIEDVSMLLDYYNISSNTKAGIDKFYTTGSTELFDKKIKDWLSLEQKSELAKIEELPTNKMDKEILIATKNVGKAREFEKMLGEFGFSVKTLLDYPEIEDVEETGTTFEENARLKAETIAKKLNMKVLADDSGLLVDALHNQPGVYSARYAGVDGPTKDAANNAKLLHELTDHRELSERKARFHCTLVLADPDDESIVVSADWHGHIGYLPQGENGFGYDPLFVVDPETGKTSAELDPAEKNQLSHRALALAKLDTILKGVFEK
ncbi:MAG: glutamate racemase [Lactobacillales bacterium]|nr:glutamate racemase [Lactobacillales bacterium]